MRLKILLKAKPTAVVRDYTTSYSIQPGTCKKLMRSCLAMNPDEGYQEARRLMKEKYGQNYKIAAAYVDRLTNGPPIRSEDGNALQKFSVQLTSCKNALKDIGYLNKLENPEALRKVIERLPYGIRTEVA